MIISFFFFDIYSLLKINTMSAKGNHGHLQDNVSTRLPAERQHAVHGAHSLPV